MLIMVEFIDVREAENAVALLYFRSSGALIFTGRIWGITTLNFCVAGKWRKK